jgi:hypothetical protein
MITGGRTLAVAAQVRAILFGLIVVGLRSRKKSAFITPTLLHYSIYEFYRTFALHPSAGTPFRAPGSARSRLARPFSGRHLCRPTRGPSKRFDNKSIYSYSYLGVYASKLQRSEKHD